MSFHVGFSSRSNLAVPFKNNFLCSQTCELHARRTHVHKQHMTACMRYRYGTYYEVQAELKIIGVIRGDLKHKRAAVYEANIGTGSFQKYPINVNIQHNFRTPPPPFYQ